MSDPLLTSLQLLSYQKLQNHMSSRSLGVRGEPELRKYVLLSNVYRQLITPPATPFPSSLGSSPRSDHSRALATSQDDWFQSCLEELSEEVPADHGLIPSANQSSVVLALPEMFSPLLQDEDSVDVDMASQDSDFCFFSSQESDFDLFEDNSQSSPQSLQNAWPEMESLFEDAGDEGDWVHCACPMDVDF